MATQALISTHNSVIRLPQDGPLLGWTRYDGDYVCAKLFATVDDSDSLPALALLASYVNRQGKRIFFGASRASYPPDVNGSVPYLQYYVLEICIAVEEFSEKGEISVEVLSFHTVLAVTLVQTVTELNTTSAYDGLKLHLSNLLAKRLRTLNDPSPESRSFENRYHRIVDEAIVTLRLPPKTTEEFKFIATTCRYPGFAFESQRVDAASFDIIAKDPANASGMLMLGDQIYADATASLFDNLTSIEKFQERYHKMFRSPGFAKAVRSIPCYMTGDDHEFSDSWSIPDNSLRSKLYAAAQQSYGVYQVSHSPFAGALNTPPYDYSFTCGPVAVYVMDTISKRDTKTPGAGVIVSPEQLLKFKTWLAGLAAHFKYVILATGGVVAPGFKIALDAARETDVSRAQGWENWQAFNDQRIKLFKILEASDRKILLVSGDYHCAAKASITKGGNHIAEAVVAPPAYAPMRYVSKTTAMLAEVETTQGYEIRMREPTEGSGFAVIKIQNGEWAVEFKTVEVADT